MSEKICRIRVRMGTVDLPNRQLKDNERTVDIIDVPLEPGERIEQIDLERQFGYGLVRHSSGLEQPTRDKSQDRWRYRAITSQEIDYTPAEGDQPALGPGTERITEAEVIGELGETS